MNNEQFNQNQTYEARPRTAADFRKKAREALKGFWVIAAVVTLVASLLGGVQAGGGNFSFNFNFPIGDSSSDVDTDIPGAEVEESEPMFTPEQMESLENAWQDFDFDTVGDIFSEVDPVLGMVFTVVGIVFVVALVFGLAFQLFLGSPIKVGYQRFFLELIDGNKAAISPATLFRPFKQGYGKTIALNVLHTLIMDATMLPMFIGLIVGSVSIFSAIPAAINGADEVMVSSILLFAGLVLMGALISICINIPVSYMYSMAHIIMADYPGMGAVDALRASRQMMKGNKFRLFCLDFSFIGWAFLAACCTCGIGAFFLTPYQYTARAAFYHEISGRRTPEDVEFPSINPDDYVIE